MVAKLRDGPYVPGERAMMKVKQHRTADCVVGGFRYRSGSNEVGSLLLGLYDTQGKLDHVGFTATIANKDRAALTAKLEALIAPPGFTGKAPGGPEPLEHRALRTMATAEAQARGRGLLRPGHRQPLPPRHQARALPSRQAP